MQDDFLVKIEEGSRNITVDLRQDPATFPEPTLFNWSKDGQPLSATELTLTYSSITIDTVRRDDAGNYTVTATNFVLSESDIPVANQLSNDTGSFYLDVICKLHKMCIYNALDVIVVKTMKTIKLMSDNGYDTPLADGPSLVLGPPQHYVLLGDSASLICGTGLDRGNPQATITWTAPNGTEIMDNNRVNIGKWTKYCEVELKSYPPE